MKNLLILIALLSLTGVSAFGQTDEKKDSNFLSNLSMEELFDINNRNDKGEKHGYWIEKSSFSSAPVKRRGSYKNGKKTGTWETYINGELQFEEEYSNGVKTETWVLEHYDNGAFAKGKLVGEYGIGKNKYSFVKYYEGGTLTKEGAWKDGQPTGRWKFYDNKGNLKSTRNF